MIAAYVLFGILFLAIFLGIPIALSLGLAALSSLVIFEPSTNTAVMVQRMFTGVDSYVFMAVPFFVLAGDLMLEGGISERLVKLFKYVFWWLPASLACITTISSAFFGAISGSNPATVSAIGGTMIPAMKKEGYPRGLAAAIAASSGTLGVIIPPSIPMVIYGITTGVSVTKLFIGGVVPGVLLVSMLCFVNIFVCRKHKIDSKKIKQEMTAEGATFWKLLKEAIWGLMMPVIILGGIYGGFFTPTEAAVVTVFYSVFVGMFIYKELTWKKMISIIQKSAVSVGIIIFIVSAAAPFAWFLTYKGIPTAVSTTILSLFSNRFIIILIMNIIMLFLGCFMSSNIIIILMAPIFLPIAAHIGLSPLALGLIMVINTSIGNVTPPMAVNLFVATRLSGCTIGEISKSVMPFLIAEAIFVGIISNFSGMLEWLPNLVG